MQNTSRKSPKRAFVDIRNARAPGYKDIISDIIKSGICPFCPGNRAWHKKPILHRIGQWVITQSSWPYENAKHHFLIIGDKHVTSFEQLNLSDLEEVLGLVEWAQREFGIKGGGLVVRFGDTKFTGATVSHLHFHFIVPKLDKHRKARPVYFPIG